MPDVFISLATIKMLAERVVDAGIYYNTSDGNARHTTAVYINMVALIPQKTK